MGLRRIQQLGLLVQIFAMVGCSMGKDQSEPKQDEGEAKPKDTLIEQFSGTVNAIRQIGNASGKVFKVDIDSRWVIYILPTKNGKEEKKYAIHSPTKTFALPEESILNHQFTFKLFKVSLPKSNTIGYRLNVQAERTNKKRYGDGTTK